MAQIFISHSHDDESLARKVAGLLGDALGLSPADFFLSSQEGQGVAPAASIRASIVNELRSVPALVVLLTPEAAASPWVWLEAGSRLGCADKSAPLFVVPSARFVPLLAPVADLRCLQLGNDGELHELVRAVGKSLGRPPLDFLSYKPALEDLVQVSAEAYSLSTERRVRAISWLKRHAVALILMAAGLGMLTYGGWLVRVASSQETTGTGGREAVSLQEFNDILASNAATFLRLKGRVTSSQSAVHGAAVMVSREGDVQDPSACLEPACTKKTTTTEGEFTIDLTKIQASNGDNVVLSVAKPGFAFFSKELVVDVRAMDAGTAPQSVALAAIGEVRP
jgi:hypothetical protein